MLDIKIIFLLIIAVIIFIIFNKQKEGFDYGLNNNQWLWYRSPYSIDMWVDTLKRQRLWSIMHRRGFLTMNNQMYMPSNNTVYA